MKAQICTFANYIIAKQTYLDKMYLVNIYIILISQYINHYSCFVIEKEIYNSILMKDSLYMDLL